MAEKKSRRSRKWPPDLLALKRFVRAMEQVEPHKRDANQVPRGSLPWSEAMGPVDPSPVRASAQETKIAEQFDALGVTRGATSTSLRNRLGVKSDDAFRLMQLRDLVAEALSASEARGRQQAEQERDDYRAWVDAQRQGLALNLGISSTASFEYLKEQASDVMLRVQQAEQAREIKMPPEEIIEIDEDGHVSASGRAVYDLEALTAAKRERDDYREAYEDTKRLARAIDVAMHGEEGAAKQASLCDLVGPARDMRLRVVALTQALKDISDHCCCLEPQGTPCERPQCVGAIARRALTGAPK